LSLSDRSEISPSRPGVFLSGARLAIPVIVSMGPFAALFGALAVKNGLSAGETVLMSVLLYAGASQMVGIELFGQAIAPWLIVFSIFAVNFRHVLYSAAVGRYFNHFTTPQKALAFFFLVDPQYAETERRGERGERISFLWYLGMALPIYLVWISLTWLGAVFGSLVTDPALFGLDFLLPIYFLGLVIAFRSRANWLPVVVASGLVSLLAWHLVGSPWHVGIGAIAGIAVAAMMPLRPRADMAASATTEHGGTKP